MDPRAIPWELIERYATRGPRYTSYPTAPHFRADVDRDALEGLWRAERGAVGLSLYVHVPYCRRRCLYCGCHTRVMEGVDEGPLRRYVDDVLREAELVATLLPGSSGPVAQLALGGGTPTVLPPALLARLVDGLDALWPADPRAERSVEVDPRTADDDRLESLFDAGFNRVSLGIQELDERVQQIVGRVQPLSLVESVVDRLRAAPHAPAINFDLIHGLPGQTAQGFGRTLAEVARLGPDRVAVFGYAHVPWMRPHQQALEGHPLPDARQRVELLGQAWEALTAAGYVPIGFDHFARPGDELARALATGSLHRNFMGYTTRRGLDLVGLGESAISAVGDSYAQDAKDQDAWRDTIRAGRMPWERGLLLSADDSLRRDVILDLSCNLRLDLTAFEERRGVSFGDRFPEVLDRLAPMVDDGLLDLDERRLRITDLGRFFVRNVCMAFDAYLGAAPADGGTPRFSQTV